MVGKILKELEHHAPFTIFGALSGLAVMFLFRNISYRAAYDLFYVFHPAHVVLSALVTASMYSFYRDCGPGKKCGLFPLLVVGYLGSVGIATISDSVIPYLGEALLKMPHREPHIGFIEEWWIVNPLAILGIAIAYFKPSTKFPHAGHVFVSTWASLMHIMMAKGDTATWGMYSLVFLFLFLAVWLPCCFSDIVFPLLFTGEKDARSCCGDKKADHARR